jgi:hypothetical protein
VRVTYGRFLAVALSALGWGQPARAGSGLALEVAGPTELHAGERAVLAIALELPPDFAPNVLLTPVAEGEALEVVRGRLMRGDARDTEGSNLRFDLPILAQTPGTGVVRVHALAYRCAPDCVAVEREARVSLVVLAP